ncbi:MAG: helix-turn-helix domain-containing protein [Candidatus Paracaedibacteraceae bacterium]|nr:helix-turn-helix domain-containing protein [Candidatus Paracaedibacteraceae bacterium]
MVEAFYFFGTNTALAKALNVTLGTVHKWLNYKSVPKPENCLKIEEATGGKVKARDIRPNYDWGNLSRRKS